MPTSSAAVRSLALAVFGLGVAPAYAQGPNVTALGTGQEPARPAVALPAPPPGPIESRLLAIPLLGDIAALPARACDGLARCRAARDNCHRPAQIEGKIAFGAW